MKTFKTIYTKCEDSHFWGNSLHCPICSKRSRLENQSKNQACHFCGSSPTTRTLWFFFNMTDITKGKKVLLINNYDYKMYISLNNEVTDVEFKESEISDTLSACNDQFYDLIVCNYVIENIFDYQAFLISLSKILKQNGTLVLQSHIDPSFKTTYNSMALSSSDRMRLFGVDNSYRIFGADYSNIITNCTGLASRVVSFSMNEKFFKYGIIDKFPIYLFSREPARLDIILEDDDTSLLLKISKHKRNYVLALLYPIMRVAKMFYNLRHYTGNSDGYVLSWRYWGKIHFTACSIFTVSLIILQLNKYCIKSLTDNFLTSSLYITVNVLSIILIISSLFLIFTYSLNSDSNCEYPSLFKKIISFTIAFIIVIIINSI